MEFKDCKLRKLYKITDKDNDSMVGKLIYKECTDRPYYLFELQNNTSLKDSFKGELRIDIKEVDEKKLYIWHDFLKKVTPYNNSLKTWLKNGA